LFNTEMAWAMRNSTSKKTVDTGVTLKVAQMVKVQSLSIR